MYILRSDSSMCTVSIPGLVSFQTDAEATSPVGIPFAGEEGEGRSEDILETHLPVRGPGTSRPCRGW